MPDIYANAGGVTVSYFEWLKNLSHVRFGRIGKRFDQAAFGAIVGAIEEVTGKNLSEHQRGVIVRGADEVDLVNSGLEETMAYAYQEIREIWKGKPEVEESDYQRKRRAYQSENHRRRRERSDNRRSGKNSSG